MVGKITTVDEFLKDEHHNRFKSKEDVLAWALRGFAKVVVMDGSLRDDVIWSKFDRWLQEAPEGSHSRDADFPVFKISQEEFEQQIGIKKILKAEQSFGEVDLRCFASDDSYLQKRIINEVVKMPEMSRFKMGTVWDFEEDAVRALLVNPPKGLKRISVEGWDNEHYGEGTSYEDKKIRQVLESTESKVMVYNHGRLVQPDPSKKKTSVREVLKEKTSKSPSVRHNGGLGY